jgi:hypothetical protein
MRNGSHLEALADVIPVLTKSARPQDGSGDDVDGAPLHGSEAKTLRQRQ